MKDRIQIDGFWYIREDLVDTEEDKIDPVPFEGVVIENHRFCFEATRLIENKESLSIEVTDKTKEPSVEHFWDNNEFFKLILENNSAAWENIKEVIFTEPDKKFLVDFLKYLKETNWL
jgi:hypothetical protein